jgi:choline kinase
MRIKLTGQKAIVMKAVILAAGEGKRLRPFVTGCQQTCIRICI